MGRVNEEAFFLILLNRLQCLFACYTQVTRGASPLETLVNARSASLCRLRCRIRIRLAGSLGPLVGKRRGLMPVVAGGTVQYATAAILRYPALYTKLY